MKTRDKFLKKIGQVFRLKRELADNKNLDSEKKEYLKDSIKILDFEILELGRVLKSEIPEKAIGEN